MKGLGTKLIALRGQESQASWAKRKGISQQTVSAWENEISNPPLEFLVEYADEKSVSLDWLAGRGGEDHPAHLKDADALKLAEELMKYPKLLRAVRSAITADKRFSHAAKEMASALGVSEEEAYAKLLAIKKEGTS